MKQLTSNTKSRSHSDFSGNVQTSNFFLPIFIIGKRTFFIKMIVILTLIMFTCLTTFGQNALHFDNTSINDYVSVPHRTSYNFGAVTTTGGAFTIEAVIKMPSAGQSLRPTILSKNRMTGSGIKGFSLFLTTGGKLAISINGSEMTPLGIDNRTDLRNNVCHRIAVTRETSTAAVTLYVDGVAFPMGGNVNNMNNSDSLFIGFDKLVGGNSKFLGTIDELRIWNTFRTTPQRAALTVSPFSSGLIAYYKFNQGISAANNTSQLTLGLIDDAWTYNNHGTFRGFTLTLGLTSNFITSNCIQDSASCNNFFVESIDSNCCRVRVTFPNSGSTQISNIKYTTVGGVAESILSTPAYSNTTPSNILSTTTGILNYIPASSSNVSITMDAQATNSSGLIVINWVVFRSDGKICRYSNKIHCKRAPRTKCDTMTITAIPWTGRSARKFTIQNTKYPISDISEITVSFPAGTPPSNIWGKGLKYKTAFLRTLNCSSPGYAVLPTSFQITSNWCPPMPFPFCGNTGTSVEYILSVPTTWAGGIVNFTIRHCDGDVCTQSYYWNQGVSSFQPFSSNIKIVDSLYALRLNLGLPSIKEKEIKYLNVEMISKNSEIFAISASEYESDNQSDTSRLPLINAFQSAKYAFFELKDNLLLDGSGPRSSINIVVSGKTRPQIKLTAYDNDGNEVISDTFTVKKNAAGVYQMVKTMENKIGLMAYPNPSASEVTLSYFIDDASDVEFTIFDITGAFIKTYVQGKKAPGNYEIKIDNSSLANGTYIIKMKTALYTKSVIMQVAK